MADNAIITVNDGASTPVAHAFEPAGIFGEVTKYQNKSAASIAARETVQLKLKQSARVRTLRVDLRVPKAITETINGVAQTSVVDYLSGNAEVIAPLGWTPAEVRNGRVMLANLLLTQVAALMADEGEFVW